MNLQRNTFVATLARAWRIASQVPPSGNGGYIFFTVIILACNSATLVAVEKTDTAWMVFAHPSDPTGVSPWIFKSHKCSDGGWPKFISSSRNEQLTGVLRSKPFAAPAKLSFWLSGYRGRPAYPEKPVHENNYVRLMDSKTGKELHRVYPPDADTAQRFDWDLSGIEHTTVQLEIVDGDNNPSDRGDAWLAVSRFAPEVVKVATFMPVEDNTNLMVAKVAFKPVEPHPEPKPVVAETTKLLVANPNRPVVANGNDKVVANGNDKVVAKAETQPLNSGGPQRGVFPPKGAGIHVHGDLVISDPVNRRGALREKRHSPRHYFAMLPYGMVRYHGAPADIRDLPPGTHLHGRFLPPLEGEEETIPLTEQLLKRDKKYGNNHAILLEDDVSFYSRQGRSWKVIGFEQGGGPAPRLKLSVEPVGPEIEGGINKPALFDIDDSTRIWKDRRLVHRDEIKPGMEVLANFTWGPFDSLATTDVWLDAVSLDAFKEIQRQRHLRLIRSRFLPGWVDAVKNYDTGGGEVTVTLFGGMDQELYDDIWKSQSVKICNAENTLRTWGYHQEYASRASVLEKQKIENPAFGSSGLQMRLKVVQMLDGFRPGKIIRVKGPWTYVLVPQDEVYEKPEDLERAQRINLP